MGTHAKNTDYGAYGFTFLQFTEYKYVYSVDCRPTLLHCS